MQSDRSNFNKNMWTILWSRNYKHEKTQENAIRPIQKTFSKKEAASKQSIQTLRRPQKSNQLQVSQTLHQFNKYAPPFLILVLCLCVCVCFQFNSLLVSFISKELKQFNVVKQNRVLTLGCASQAHCMCTQVALYTGQVPRVPIIQGLTNYQFLGFVRVIITRQASQYHFSCFKLRCRVLQSASETKVNRTRI